MKQILLILCAVIVALIAAYFFVSDTGEVTPLPNTQTQKSAPMKVEETKYGFSFTYPSGEDAYVVVTPKDAPHGDLVYAASVFDTQQYAQMQASQTPTEAPVSLSLEVYRNPQQLSVREWITRTDASNYRLSTDGTISSSTVGMSEFLTYQYDGLYRADAYVYGKDGYIYLFSNMWDNPESGMKKDMEKILSTIRWSAPVVSAQVAHGDIVVTTPKEDEEITSPVKVEGMARGSWYFEASFPMVLVDWDGRIIAQGVAQAQGDWMTQDYVPFTGELSFTKPEGGNARGALILKKDNPSGMPENDDAIEIPVTFK